MADSERIKAYKKIAETVVSGYKKIEDTVDGGYKMVEGAVVSGYQKVEDAFVSQFLTHDGESVEEAKARLRDSHTGETGN